MPAIKSWVTSLSVRGRQSSRSLGARILAADDGALRADNAEIADAQVGFSWSTAHPGPAPGDPARSSAPIT